MRTLALALAMPLAALALILALCSDAWACSDHWPYATAPALPYGQPSVRCYTITQQGQVFTYCR
jgi:hypothetical protein